MSRVLFILWKLIIWLKCQKDLYSLRKIYCEWLNLLKSGLWSFALKIFCWTILRSIAIKSRPWILREWNYELTWKMAKDNKIIFFLILKFLFLLNKPNQHFDYSILIPHILNEYLYFSLTNFTKKFSY